MASAGVTVAVTLAAAMNGRAFRIGDPNIAGGVVGETQTLAVGDCVNRPLGG
ncbi:MAG: hypothetical protein RIR77_1224 [Planctomycetota bacterium]